MAELGVLGSAFNPPHLGHLSLLSAAVEQVCLDEVIVVPTGDSYHKEVDEDPGRATRFRLAEAAFAGFPGVSVSAIEVDRDGPSYTCDTLEGIEDLYPDSEIHLLMGADSAKGFSGWHRPERILELAKVVVAPRNGVMRQEVESAFAGLGAAGSLRFLDMSEIIVSSNEVRQLIHQGEAYRQLVPEPVAEIIENEDLYGQSKD